MPGQTIVAGDIRTTDLLDALRGYCFDERYTARTDANRAPSGMVIGWTSYPGYPIEEYQIRGRTVWVEGCLYNHPRDSIEDLLAEVVDAVAGGDDETLSDLLLRSDGEYLITIADDEAVTVVTDPLGRLPLGTYSDDEWAILARHKLLIADLVGGLGVSPIDAASYLRWGFVIGGRSLLEGIQRVPPASVVTVSQDALRVNPYHEWRVDSERYADRTVAENATEMARLFSEGCRRRDENSPGETLALLSGGLDSRAILGPLGESPTFSATTRNHPTFDAQQDIAIAEKLANEMGVEWEEYRVGMPTPEQVERHMRMKGGLDPISTSHELPHLEHLIDEHPGSTIMSGSGGDKLIPDQRPAVSVTSEAEAVSYLMKSADRLPMEDVTDLTGISKTALREHLATVVATYPEPDPVQKVIHFKFFERMYAWLFEAGDMNRCHLWNTSPYYTIEFFRYALAIPDEQKAGHELFAAWLSALDERLVEVENANTRTTVGSIPHRVQLRAYHFLTAHPTLFEIIKPTAKAILQGDESDSEVTYPVDIPQGTGLLQGRDIEAVLSDSSLPRGSRYQLLTLAVIEQLLSTDVGEIDALAR